MSLNSINITVAHSLRQDSAFARVLTWLQAQSKPAFVTAKQTNVNHTLHTINLIMDVHGYPLNLLIDVGADRVTVTSNRATDMVESAAMWFENMRLQKQLAAVLK